MCGGTKRPKDVELLLRGRQLSSLFNKLDLTPGGGDFEAAEMEDGKR